MSLHDVRKLHYEVGCEDGAKEERERLASRLDAIVSSADVQGAVIALIGELRTIPGAGTAAVRSPSPARGAHAAPQATGDLGDQIVSIMMQKRGRGAQ